MHLHTKKDVEKNHARPEWAYSRVYIIETPEIYQFIGRHEESEMMGWEAPTPS
jgi:hypothetical protein